MPTGRLQLLRLFSTLLAVVLIDPAPPSMNDMAIVSPNQIGLKGNGTRALIEESQMRGLFDTLLAGVTKVRANTVPAETTP
jgi:hypothetical protein